MSGGVVRHAGIPAALITRASYTYRARGTIIARTEQAGEQVPATERPEPVRIRPAHPISKEMKPNFTLPQLTIVTSPDGTGYGISGWEEFERFAHLNIGPWQATSKIAGMGGMNETDKLKLLAARMLELHLKSREDLLALEKAGRIIPSVQLGSFP